MNKKQREERDAKIIDMRLNNYSMAEIASILNITFGIVYTVSHKNNLGGKRSNRKATYNPPSIPKKKQEDKVAEFIKERLPQFEYAGNYTGSEGAVDIKCVVCGTTTTRSMISIRHSCVVCRTCEQIKIQQRKLEKKKEQKLLAEERKREKFWSRQFNQIEMKQCPTCRAFFIGGRTYCSDKCRQQNHWHMKDGYRNLFPLEEVYERDGGVCYLCGQPCDWGDFIVKDGVIVYGNNYPSRDHVVPKSQGGKNEWQNIRLAHRGCNSRKGIAPISKK